MRAEARKKFSGVTPTKSTPYLWLAPMEGVVDFIMRDFLTGFGGIDHCVTEFVRVVNQPIPESVFLRYCPELKTDRRTSAGTPVAIQLLGSDPEWIARSAMVAVQLGAKEIDLNFGCPAKTVNRHDGGATLLKTPERLFQITSAIRAQLPAHIPLSAKMRLGFENPEDCIVNAQALQAGGVSHLTVHCRTKMDMYKPPAFWSWIRKIKAAGVKIPIIANGDIFTVEDFRRCQEETECESLMIGRGALKDPMIFTKIKGLASESSQIESRKIREFFQINCSVSPHFAQARTKQWLKNMTGGSPAMLAAFDQLKVISEPSHFEKQLEQLF